MRRFQKIGIFAKQNAKYTVIWYEDPNIWDFLKKIHGLSILSAEYSKNLEHLVRFCQKIGKFAILYAKY